MTELEKAEVRGLLKEQADRAEEFMESQTDESFKAFTRAQWRLTDAMMSARVKKTP